MRASSLWKVLWLLSLPACGGSDRDAMNKRLSSLRDDITRLQADNDRLGERIEALEARSSAPPVSNPGPAQPIAKNSGATTPALRVVKLVPSSAPDSAVGDGQSGEVAAEDRTDAPGARPVIRVYGREERTRTRGSARQGALGSAEEAP